MPARSKVFISYSHKDTDWLNLLRVHLKPVERLHGIDIWDDKKIAPGMLWKDEISKALAGAKVAVLLVSADFLNSEFIDREELPPLLEAAHREGVRILPVLLKPSMFTDIEALQRYQAVNPPERALSKLSEADRDEQLVNIARAIAQAMRDSAAPAPAAVVAKTAELAQAASDEDDELSLPEALEESLQLMVDEPDIVGLTLSIVGDDGSAEVMYVAENAEGDVMCGLVPNDQLPKELRLSKPAQRYLVDELGFNAPETRGEGYWVDLGPGSDIDLAEMTEHVLALFDKLWGVPNDDLQIGWEPMGR